MVHNDQNLERVRRRSMLLMLRGRAFIQSVKSRCRMRPLIGFAMLFAMLSSIVVMSFVGKIHIDRQQAQLGTFRDRGLSPAGGAAADIMHRPPSGAQARKCIREMGEIHACVNQRRSNCTAAAYWKCLRVNGFADGQYTALVRHHPPPPEPAPCIHHPSIPGPPSLLTLSLSFCNNTLPKG